VNAEVKEALPDLLNGRLSALDTATMKAHVESCADCRSELELLRQAKTSALLIPAMDAAKIAAAIPPYPRVPAHVAPKQPVDARFKALRIAAVAVLIAAGGLVWSVTSRGGVEPVTRSAVNTADPDASVALPGGAGSTLTESVRGASASSETQVASLSLVGSTSDLSDADLELLVAELDEMEPLPAEEPQSFTNTVEDLGSDEDSGL
jgi:predicted anti-sigma-YlaC factor YlaD